MKALIALPDRCTGCQRCVLACSYARTKAYSPSKSRIWVIRLERKIDQPIFCNQCGICIGACPVNALSREKKTGAIIVNEERCIGCGYCVNACPWGVIVVDRTTHKAIKCDLCGGYPACVKECPEQALQFVDIGKAAEFKRGATIKLLLSSL